MATLPSLIDRFRGKRVLVVGDMVADEYIVGRPSRISREAPVLILLHSDSFIRPGGATNTAYNLSSLGARTSVIGAIGDDEMGGRLRTTLEREGIETSCLLVDPSRPTSTKTRIVAKGTQEVQQQIVRVDRVDTTPVGPPHRDTMIDSLRHALATFDAILIADYENGLISPELIQACLPLARHHSVPVIVDAHGGLFRFRGITAATPNQPEAASTLGMTIETQDDLERAGHQLLAGMDAESILITRGSEGVALFERDSPPYHLPVAMDSSQRVVDPNGAGDTVAAVFTLAILAGATMRQAAFLGNLAGGQVVQRLGAATMTRDELHAALSQSHLSAPE
jgi:D-glycero-beta-D-manno-heptose-7-phosphate kinase